MGKIRGQISIEYTAVLASMLIILVLLIVIFNGIYSQQSLHTQYVRSQHVVSSLATHAKSVWMQGPGAYSYVSVVIPESVQLNSSSIKEKSLNLYVAKFGDAFEFADFDILGNWPNQTGSSIMSVRNNGSHVLIRPAALVSVSKTGFYFNSSGSDTLTITNYGADPILFTEKLFFPSCSDCIYGADSSVSYLPSGVLRNNTLSIPSLAPGIYSGYIQINISYPPYSVQHENISLIIPITVVRQ